MNTANPIIPKGRSGKGKLYKYWYPYFYLLPAAVVVITIIGYPVVRAVVTSLFHDNPLNPKMTFVGFSNYVSVLEDHVFHVAVLNSLIWIFGIVLFQFGLGMIGALLLNEKFRGRGVVRGLVLIPWATPSVLAAMMWIWILDANHGVVNDLLTRMGLSFLSQPWFSQPHTALPALMLIDIWQGVPFFAVMILAALQTIPEDLVEASFLDGATAWNTFWQVKFPIILPTVLITTLLRIVWTASYMDLILVITQGGPGYATLTVPAYAYYMAYSDLNFGGATATAVLQGLALLGVVLVYLKILTKQGILEK
ncbi:carbohydrate ABC transporter permease [Acididesulfobacillus acetoxydans]|uniref:carbohydrate ABC transporter permease n=1 Tax=Acididesulfobacillus acetoxydans TaxID=1561005 RepID=UPI001F0CEDBD|nr:sugar ABC transporter permease [Acididesulfobacillus acetoxydans]